MFVVFEANFGQCFWRNIFLDEIDHEITSRTKEFKRYWCFGITKSQEIKSCRSLFRNKKEIMTVMLKRNIRHVVYRDSWWNWYLKSRHWETVEKVLAQLIETTTRDLDCWRKARIRTSKSTQETDTMNNVGLKKEKIGGQSVQYK